MAKLGGAVSAATRTVVHGGPVTPMGAVPATEMTGTANAMQTPPDTKKANDAACVVALLANNGQENKKRDATARQKRRRRTAADIATATEQEYQTTK